MMHSRLRILLVSMTALLAIAACNQQSDNADTAVESGDMKHESSATDEPSSQMHMAMVRMSDDMAKMKMSGDTDRDFAGMMIIHHQGAIDMAELQVKNGKDPELKAMAQEMIDAQKAEQVKLREHLSN